MTSESYLGTVLDCILYCTLYCVLYFTRIVGKKVPGRRHTGLCIMIGINILALALALSHDLSSPSPSPSFQGRVSEGILVQIDHLHLFRSPLQKQIRSNAAWHVRPVNSPVHLHPCTSRAPWRFELFFQALLYRIELIGTVITLLVRVLSC